MTIHETLVRRMWIGHYPNDNALNVGVGDHIDAVLHCIGVDPQGDMRDLNVFQSGLQCVSNGVIIAGGL